MPTATTQAHERKTESSSSLASQLDLFRQPVLRAIAPGIFVPTNPQHIPEVILCKVIECGGGQVRLEPFREDWIQMDPPSLRMIGMGNKRNTLLRLSDGGFIECVKTSPGVWLLNLTSWYNHLRRVAEAAADGEDFWATEGDNYKVYIECARWR